MLGSEYMLRGASASRHGMVRRGLVGVPVEEDAAPRRKIIGAENYTNVPEISQAIIQ